MYLTPSTFFESVMSLLPFFSEIHGIPFLSSPYIFMPLFAGCLGCGTEDNSVNTHILNAVIFLKLENKSIHLHSTLKKGYDDRNRERLGETTRNILTCNKEIIERMYSFCFLLVRRDKDQAERNSKPQTSAAEIVACQPKMCRYLKGKWWLNTDG